MMEKSSRLKTSIELLRHDDATENTTPALIVHAEVRATGVFDAI